MAFNWKRALQGGTASLSASYGDHLAQQREWERQQKLMQAQTMREKELAKWQREKSVQWGDEDYNRQQGRTAGEIASREQGMLQDPDKYSQWSQIEKDRYAQTGEYPKSLASEQLDVAKGKAQAEIDIQLENMDGVTKAKLKAEADSYGMTLPEYLAEKKQGLLRGNMTAAEKGDEELEASFKKAEKTLTKLYPDLEKGSEMYNKKLRQILQVEQVEKGLSAEQKRLWQKDAYDAAMEQTDGFTDEDAVVAGYTNLKMMREAIKIDYLSAMPRPGQMDEYVPQMAPLIAAQPEQEQEEFLKDVEKNQGKRVAEQAREDIKKAKQGMVTEQGESDKQRMALRGGFDGYDKATKGAINRSKGLKRQRDLQDAYSKPLF